MHVLAADGNLGMTKNTHGILVNFFHRSSYFEKFMPKWLHNMVAPTMVLWLYAVTYMIAYCLSSRGPGMPKHFDLMAYFATPYVIASWVVADARKRSRQLCYDYDSLLFFFWPIIVAVYLFQTRGARAFLTLLYFIGTWVVAGMISIVLRSIMGN